MWLPQYDKCIYLNSHLTLWMPVSFCGFKHYTRNRTRTSWMTSQDLNRAGWDSLPNSPLALTEIACALQRVAGAGATVGVVCSIRLNLQWGTFIPRSPRMLLSADSTSDIWSWAKGAMQYLLHWLPCWALGSLSKQHQSNHRLVENLMRRNRSLTNPPSSPKVCSSYLIVLC